jgi:hypothetical protein
MLGYLFAIREVGRKAKHKRMKAKERKRIKRFYTDTFGKKEGKKKMKSQKQWDDAWKI